ncbi:hypothetical protein B0A52_04942 [Exophiala mesophila]|uniref:Major facilitator superfamily (MFS) profile domain-containing protein n=1 Tax=Exophiala mesophila TaxID=212818 RepID=A0A438N6L6_EXOME|nr:hypothetical protein B0A52_04942 [Exophiala mesophila]
MSSRDMDIVEKNNGDQVRQDHGATLERPITADESPPTDIKRTTSNTLSRVTSRLSTRHIVDPGPPPDGGLTAWTQVAAVFLCSFTSWGYINSFGIFQTYYTEALGESPSTISWVGSVQLWVVFVVSTFSGRALDAGLLIPTFIVGVVLHIIGIFMTSLSTVFWQLLLAQGVCTGLGSGIFFTPTMGLITTYFTSHRGLAIAITSTGNSAGGAIYPVIVRQLLPRIGFAWTIRVLGFVNLSMLLVVLAFIRPRLPPRRSGPIVEWQAFRELPYTLLIIGMSFVFGGLFFTYYYLASYARTILEMSYEDSLIVLIVFNAGAIPVRLMSGFVADRFFGPLNAVIPLLCINAIFAFAWTSVTSRSGFYAFSTLFGFSAGAFQCLLPTTVASLNDDLSKSGVRLGMAFSIFSFSGLAGPPIGGALLTSNGGGRSGWLVAQLCLGFTTLIGAVFVAAARVCKHGWSLKIKV